LEELYKFVPNCDKNFRMISAEINKGANNSADSKIEKAIRN
jgi:hypothetical protein